MYHRTENPRYADTYIDGVSIYNQGVHCGYFRTQELYPFSMPGVTGWQSELGLEVIMGSMGFRGAAKLKEHVTDGAIERYYYVGRKNDF